LAIIGSVYVSFAALLLGGFSTNRRLTRRHHPSVTILKPLCGAEPGLEAKAILDRPRSFSASRNSADPAASIARRLMSAFPHVSIDLEINAQSHGANRKISNVLNSVLRNRGEIVALSDSDIRVGRT
jgi:ceramide glucosyltransferase